ncbi:uncharacterized protein LOC128278815 [Anopheles cruzii]|uniref:uncharacterized protein LOC128278815 n=1 Tax=Anopheles cruzii TaxID=68878 RepID=UPI0022EC34EA|nr:uncharacterized protein LOC128278815 [Anopheles cruzii]
MKVLVLLACVALVAARPEPPVGGYSHNQGGHYHHGGGHGGHGGYSYQQPAAAPVPLLHSGSVGQFSGSAAAAASASASYDTQSLGGGGGGGLSSFSGAVADAGAQSFGGAVQAESFGAPQQQIVQKHIYVHVPPPEQQQTFHQTISAPALRQKHYKIIFIKTPSVESHAAQLALQQSQTEEKTIVYVLVKKPEPLADITLPAAAVSKPSKPEVYFIKYKTNSEAVGGGAATGASAAGLGLLSSSGSASASHSQSVLCFRGQIRVPELWYFSSWEYSPAQTYGAPGGHGGYH